MEVYAEGAHIRQERICPDCRGRDFVEDHAAGDIVCRGCGLVVEAHIIDERSEWRTFGDKDKEGDDPSRVGAATNPLLSNGGLSTGIAKMPGTAGGGQYSMLMKLHNRQTGSDRNTQQASREINEICERLKLPDMVKNSALEVYRDTQEYKTLKGRSARAVYAACIFVAGKRENSHRTFKEICAVMGPDVDKVDIGRCFTAIDKMYKTRAQFRARQQGVDLNEVKGGLQPNRATGRATAPTDVMKRLMSKLTADKKLSLFGQRVAERAGELAAGEAVPWAARDPSTQASAMVYGVMQIHKLQQPDGPTPMVTWESLAAGSGMAPNTIRDCYKMMLPYFVVPGKLVSENDAKPDVLAQLEAAFKAAPAPGGDSKGARKAK